MLLIFILIFFRFGSWCSQVQGYFSGTLFPVQTNHALDLSAINADGIFLPVLPLFEGNPSAAISSFSSSSSSSSSPSSSEVVLVNGPSSVIPLSYIPSFLAEQQRSFDEKYAAFEKVFPKDKEIITSNEAKLMASCVYALSIGKALSEGISFIEEMLYEQLVAAVGKVCGKEGLERFLLWLLSFISFCWSVSICCVFDQQQHQLTAVFLHRW